MYFTHSSRYYIMHDFQFPKHKTSIYSSVLEVFKTDFGNLSRKRVEYRNQLTISSFSSIMTSEP